MRQDQRARAATAAGEAARALAICSPAVGGGGYASQVAEEAYDCLLGHAAAQRCRACAIGACAGQPHQHLRRQQCGTVPAGRWLGVAFNNWSRVEAASAGVCWPGAKGPHANTQRHMPWRACPAAPRQARLTQAAGFCGVGGAGAGARPRACCRGATNDLNLAGVSSMNSRRASVW